MTLELTSGALNVDFLESTALTSLLWLKFLKKRETLARVLADTELKLRYIIDLILRAFRRIFSF